jgi:hypothetical protein
VPLVVTEILSSGAPAAAYPMTNVGVVALDPRTGTVGNQMKAAFAQFLSLRHGGSGYVFGYGSGATGQNYAVHMTTDPLTAPFTAIPADRPFHSLSYPDIDYTILRPAALPPSAFTDPVLAVPAPAYPPGYNTSGTAYVNDPGVRNTSLYQGFVTGLSATPLGSTPVSTPASALLVPPIIPPRRLFQPPDSIAGSNASETGDLYLNNLQHTTSEVNTGALPFTLPIAVNNNVVDLFWAPGTPMPAGVTTPYLGANTGAGGPPTPIDYRQSPYFRTQLMQKAMNLTTVRTHQYAVWITIGFFEVKRQGDLGMLFAAAGTPLSAGAYDIMGPEVGASTGQVTRYRTFFVVDRLRLTGFDHTSPDSFRPAVLYRQNIE